VYNSEEDAARQYDRALIIEKGKEAKTNFPLTDYTREVQEYEAFLLSRSAMPPLSSSSNRSFRFCLDKDTS
jgi:hypothetical protein